MIRCPSFLLVVRQYGPHSLSHFVPRNSLNFSGVDFVNSSRNLVFPCFFHAVINDRVETFEQCARHLYALLFRQQQCLFENLRSFFCHVNCLASATIRRRPSVAQAFLPVLLGRDSRRALYLRQKTRSVQNRSSKIFRNRLPHVRQRRPHSQIHSRSEPRRIRNDRHILPRMIRRLPTRIRIAPMIRRNHQQIAARKLLQKIAQHLIKLFQRLCESLHILAMPIQHVEIHQVAEDQSVRPLVHRGRQFLHSVGVRNSRDVALHASPVINVVDLSDSENRHLLLRQHIHQHRFRRLYCIIMAPRRSHKMSRSSCEWPRDHPPHAMRTIQNFPRYFAHFIKLRNRHNRFVGGNLENAVARRVHNRLPGTHVLFAQLLDNFRSRGRLIPNRFLANPPLKFLNHFRRKSVFVHRKRLLQPHSRHLPMSCRRIFSRRMGRTLSVRRSRFCRRRQMRQRRNVCQSQRHQIRQSQWPRFRNVPQRVSPHIPILRRIRQFANSHAVQHNPDYPPKSRHDFTPQPLSAQLSATLAQLPPTSVFLRISNRNRRNLSRIVLNCLHLNYSSFLCVLRVRAVLTARRIKSPGCTC